MSRKDEKRLTTKKSSNRFASLRRATAAAGMLTAGALSTTATSVEAKQSESPIVVRMAAASSLLPFGWPVPVTPTQKSPQVLLSTAQVTFLQNLHESISRIKGNPSFLSKMSIMESNADPTVPNSSANANGALQIVPNTMISTIRNHAGELRLQEIANNLEWDPDSEKIVIRIGSQSTEFKELNPSSDLYKQVAYLHEGDLRQALKNNLDREPTENEMALGWFFGSGNGAKFIKALSRPDDLAKDITPGAVGSNKTMFFEVTKRDARGNPTEYGRAYTVGEFNETYMKRWNSAHAKYKSLPFAMDSGYQPGDYANNSFVPSTQMVPRFGTIGDFFPSLKQVSDTATDIGSHLSSFDKKLLGLATVLGASLLALVRWRKRGLLKSQFVQSNDPDNYFQPINQENGNGSHPLDNQSISQNPGPQPRTSSDGPEVAMGGEYSSLFDALIEREQQAFLRAYGHPETDDHIQKIDSGRRYHVKTGHNSFVIVSKDQVVAHGDEAIQRSILYYGLSHGGLKLSEPTSDAQVKQVITIAENMIKGGLLPEQFQIEVPQQFMETAAIAKAEFWQGTERTRERPIPQSRPRTPRGVPPGSVPA